MNSHDDSSKYCNANLLHLMLLSFKASVTSFFYFIKGNSSYFILSKACSVKSLHPFSTHDIERRAEEVESLQSHRYNCGVCLGLVPCCEMFNLY